MKIKVLVAWYDFWIGAYWDRVKRALYILPVPCFGVVVEFPILELSIHTTCPDCGGLTTLQDGPNNTVHQECNLCLYVGSSYPKIEIDEICAAARKKARRK